VRPISQGTRTGTGAGTGAILDLGNERDVADYVLYAYGDAGEYEAATSEMLSVAEGEGRRRLAWEG